MGRGTGEDYEMNASTEMNASKLRKLIGKLKKTGLWGDEPVTEERKQEIIHNWKCWKITK